MTENTEETEKEENELQDLVNESIEAGTTEQVEEEDEDGTVDEQALIEKKRQKILSKKIDLDKFLQKDEKEKTGSPKKIEDIDLKAIDYKSFDNINTEHIDLYYMLNDNKNNIEFLDEDLVTQSKKEDEKRAMRKQEKDEFDFNLEELVDENRIKVDLTGIADDLGKNE